MCGIYALFAPGRSRGRERLAIVRGAVVLWGRIELHRRGMRAEFARIVTLALPSSQGHTDAVFRVARQLDVEAVRARDLPLAAQAYGDAARAHFHPELRSARVATLVARQPSTSAVFAAVTEEAGRLLGAQTTNLMRVANPELAVIVAGWSEGAAHVPIGSTGLLDGRGLVGKIVTTGQPSRVEDFDQVGGAVAEAMRNLGLRSGVAGTRHRRRPDLGCARRLLGRPRAAATRHRGPHRRLRAARLARDRERRDARGARSVASAARGGSMPRSERLDTTIEAAAYFVVSEALTNVAKYAQATSARVDLQVAGGTLVVSIADNGVGGADPGLGSGLRGLVDRVQAVGGRLEVNSPPGRGTRLRAELPTNVLGSLEND